jgi:hypothetical protein
MAIPDAWDDNWETAADVSHQSITISHRHHESQPPILTIADTF